MCPVCKRKVFAADERVETDSESDSEADDSTPLIRDGQRAGTQGGTFNEPSEDDQDLHDDDFVRQIMRRRRRLLIQHMLASQTSSSGTSYTSEAQTDVINELSGNDEVVHDLGASTSNVEENPREFHQRDTIRHAFDGNAL